MLKKVKKITTTQPFKDKMEIKNKKVLIGFAESLSAPEVAWNLIDAGLKVVAFTRQGHRPPLRRIKCIEIIEVSTPEENSRKTVDQLCKFVEKLKTETIMPLDDVSVWLCNAVSRRIDCSVAGPTGINAQLAIDKRLQLKYALEAGFNVPKTQHVRFKNHLSRIDCFPVVLKPALAVTELDGKLCKADMHFCADRKQLNEVVSKWQEGQPLLAQEIIPGTGEGLFGLGVIGGVKNWSAHRRIRMMNPQGSGSSACMSLPITDQPLVCSELMLKRTNWTGLFMIELLRDPFNKLWFMELNGRSWGSMIRALRMGFNYPVWTVMQTIDPNFKPPIPPEWKPIICRHIGREIVHIMMVLKKKKSCTQSSWFNTLRLILKVFHIDRNEYIYNWRKETPSLFIEDTIETVLEKILAKLRFN